MESMKTHNRKPMFIIIISVILFIMMTAMVVLIVYSQSYQSRIQKKLELAERYLDELDYEQAIAAYEAVIEIDPKCVEAYLGLADVYIEMGDMDQAMNILKEAYSETNDRIISDRINAAFDIDEPESPDDAVQETEEENSIEPTIIPDDERDIYVEREESPQTLSFDDIPKYFQYFTWTTGSIGTTLEIGSDGSFVGDYSLYVSVDIEYFESNHFEGRFEPPVQIDEYTYLLRIESITKQEASVETGEGYQKSIVDPAGIANESDMFLYLPGTPIEHIDVEMQNWVMNIGNVGRSGDLYGGVDVLPEGYYGLYQPGNGCGFIGIEE